MALRRTLTFVLMLAAFIYTARSVANDQNRISVTAQIAQQGTSTPSTLPRDELLMVVHRRDTVDKLTVLDGTTGSSTNLTVTTDNIEHVLDGLKTSLERSAKINIGVWE